MFSDLEVYPTETSIKNGLFRGQISRLHANTRCATQRRGDNGGFDLTKTGWYHLFQGGGSWEVGAIFPSHKKWWANMSPTSFFFGGLQAVFLERFLFFQTSQSGGNYCIQFWGAYLLFEMGCEKAAWIVSYKYLEKTASLCFFLSSLVRNWW